jgi:asparagine synthase (glutamine-hydrolysing)
MCGIAGIVHARADAKAAMARMLHALRHRGPDGEGEVGDEQAVFGHRRLSIIDLEGGRQPIVNADRSIWLVCNGEIYNYRELRSPLEREGYPFQTHSDCELIIALYERHGDRVIEHLRGMFAFALWDVRKRRLLIARDHLGQKPLYYANTAAGFAFASEIKALLACDHRLREMDLRALDQYLALRLIAPPLSMYKGIHKLPPGHLLVLEEGGEPQLRRYWDLAYLPKLSGSDDALTDELEAKIEESLRLHLVSDVPVGAFLSGGLDSSLLVAMLARRVGVENVPTFTLGLPYAQFDEAPHARAVARLCRTDHHEGVLDATLLRYLPSLIYHLDEPSDPLSLCAYQVAELASRHVKVAIGGDGGDELFGGYDRYYGNLYAGRYAAIPAALRRSLLQPLLALFPESGWYKSKGHQLRWLHQLSFLEGADRYAASLTYFYFNQDARRRLLTPEASRQLTSRPAEVAIAGPYRDAAGDPLDRMLHADSCVRLPDHPVMITDRMSMAHGLEARSPFMDHRLAEFAARLPNHLKVHGRALRVIQRRLARRYLPAEIIDRPKQGFSSALPYLLRAEYRTLYEAALSDSRLVQAGILQAGPIRELVSEQLAGRADHGNRLWLLVNAELWYRMMILGESSGSLAPSVTAAAI